MTHESVRVETDVLGGSPLARLVQAGSAPVSWYPARPRTAEEWRHYAERVSASSPGNWHEVLAPALASSGAAAARLARVIEGNGVVVTTGQQPGLFGGPVYTWSKAVSALALADAIEASTGLPAAPVFWAATDDSDFAEASHTMLARSGGADRLSIESTMPGGTRLIDVPLPDMTAHLERLAAACGSVADPRPLQATRDAYRRGATVGSAYVTLLRALLEPMGISVVDATHPAVGQAAHPLLLRALHERERIGRALEARRAELIAAGHPPQVTEMADLTLVFERRGLRRERIARTRAAVAAATAEPGALSPNVLLRPLLERGLFPTVAYVAGPGELAYFAQVSAVADAMGMAVPLAVPRWSATLVEPHVADILTRFGLTPADFADPHAVETRLARAAWPAGVASAMSALRGDLAARLGGVRAALDGVDELTPAATVEGTARAMEWRLSRLERRITAGVKRQEVVLMRDLGTARGALFPGGSRQERALNLIPMLATHGTVLLDAMRAGAAVHARSLVGSAPEPAVTR